MKRILLGFSIAALGLLSQLGHLNELEKAARPTYAREISSMAFPRHKLTNDTGDILDEYPDYLRFVLDAGRASDPRMAQILEKKYLVLAKTDKAFTARFLRGLRFELVARSELKGLPARGLTNTHPMMRRWIGKYLRQWAREADEYLFRAYVAKRARKA